MTDNIYLWDNFDAHPPLVQEEMLRELETILPRMTWKDAAATFDGAPEWVILKFLPRLPFDCQVWIWKNALPIGARAKAEKLLSPEARRVLFREKTKEYNCFA